MAPQTSGDRPGVTPFEGHELKERSGILVSASLPGTSGIAEAGLEAIPRGRRGAKPSRFADIGSLAPGQRLLPFDGQSAEVGTNAGWTISGLG